LDDQAPIQLHILSLHDALPISNRRMCCPLGHAPRRPRAAPQRLPGGPLLGASEAALEQGGISSAGTHFVPDEQYVGANRYLQRPDRKSTRLNSSHVKISYAVFC